MLLLKSNSEYLSNESAVTRQENVPLSSVVTLKMNSFTKFWLGSQARPNLLIYLGGVPVTEELTSATVFPSKNISKDFKINSVKAKCQFKVALVVPSKSCLLLKCFTGSAAACTIWVGGGSFQVKLAPSEKSKASVSCFMNNYLNVCLLKKNS